MWRNTAPIETLGVYETEDVQKVYWVDSGHQPRVINITKPEQEGQAIFPDSDYSYLYNRDIDYFNFIPNLKLNEVITVSKDTTGGRFSPGTIQYAFSYYNKFGS